MKKYTAFNYIKHSALFGYGDAQNYMGLYYEHGYIFEKDIETAIEWYLLAAKQEHVTAQINLDFAYFKMKNYRKAIEWTLKAAKKGNEEAIKNLDMILEETFWAQGEKYKNLKYHNPSEPIEIGDLVFSNEFNEAFAWLPEYQNKSKSNGR